MSEHPSSPHRLYDSSEPRPGLFVYPRLVVLAVAGIECLFVNDEILRSVNTVAWPRSNLDTQILQESPPASWSVRTLLSEAQNIYARPSNDAVEQCVVLQVPPQNHAGVAARTVEVRMRAPDEDFDTLFQGW